MSSQFNDTDDDLPLHTRGTGREAYGRSEGHAIEMNDAPLPEREVTLNTGVVLGLFFALALLCAVFFGFGYSIGHKSAPAAVASAEPEVVTTTESTGTGSPTPKPSPTVPEYVPSTGADRPATTAVKPVPPATAPSSKPVVVPPVSAGGAAAPPARVVRIPAPAAEVPPAAQPAPAAAGSGTTYVQVAAVSHQEDADVLLSALRRRGYSVQTRSEPADHLIHVQLGPFGTRKEADEMRKRLAGDGYNAFIK